MKKKNSRTRVYGTRVPCEVLEFMELKLLEKIQVELEFHELEYFTWYSSSWNLSSKKKKKKILSLRLL